MLQNVISKLPYIIACLVVPVVWGAAVNWAFDLWQARRSGEGDEPIFPDYQI